MGNSTNQKNRLAKILRFLKSIKSIEMKNNMAVSVQGMIDVLEPYTQGCFGCKHREQYNFQEPCLTCVHVPRIDNFEKEEKWKSIWGLVWYSNVMENGLKLSIL